MSLEPMEISQLTKPIWKSKTIYGAIGTLAVAGAALYFDAGLSISPGDIVTSISLLASTAFTIYGRVTAKTEIK